MRYMAPLDGIRAIAILAVLIFHVSPGALPGGFTGVDVFFVLSGFLITSIILQDVRERSFSLREFYLRRIQRLLPNVLATVLVVLVLWTIFMLPSVARETGQHGLWTIFNLSNVYIWRELGGYWGGAAEAAPLTHAWSLGVEEQFYLLFPAFLLLLARLQPRRLAAWLGVATLLGFGLCAWGTHAHPFATFYLLPTRVWELLLGAALAAHRTPLVGDAATAPFSRGQRTREALGWLGIAAIVAGSIFIDEHDAFPGMVSLAPTLGTLFLLLSVVDGESSVSRALSHPFMVATGKYSYSLYLWHWPLITLGKIQAELHGLPRLAGAIVGGICGIALALAAYALVERPLRDRGPGRRRRLAIIATGFALTALACGVVALRRAPADPDNRFDAITFSVRQYNAGRAAGFEKAGDSVPLHDLECPPPSHPDDAWRSGGVLHLHGGEPPRVVVLGSSHAMMYSRLLDEICRERGLSVAFLALDGGTPAFFESPATAVGNPNFSTEGEARDFDDARRAWLREWRPEIVFVIDRWDIQVSKPGDFDARLRAFLSEVSPLAGRVIFVAQVPVIAETESVNLRELVLWRMRARDTLPRLMPDESEPRRLQAAKAAVAATAEFTNLRVLKPELAFRNDDGSIRYAAGRTFYYADDDHLSDAGTEIVRPMFEAAIDEARSAARP